MNLKKIAPTLLLGITCFASLLASPAVAQEAYPSKPIRLVLGFAAGGGTDTIARALAERIGGILGQQVIVDNKTGANGNIAGEIVARSPADGYTLLYNTSSIVISPALYPKLSYDVSKELAPVAMTANLPLVLVASKKLEVRSVQDLISLMKRQPGKLNYGSAGNGNITHLSTLALLQATGTQAIHVPYRSEAPAIADLAGGQIDFYLATAPAAIPMIKDDRIRGLAVGTLERVDTLPQIPTLSETVAKGLEMGAWSGIMAPAGTRPEIIQKLNAAIATALNDKGLRERFAGQGALVQYMPPAKYGAFIQSELPRWSQIVRENAVKID
ncbi:MAG: hypothetical protein K0Q43_1466 [Ramlibacter sp.]|jgi:tripartite-type tricarboxylate transporter receptor subunit TctC|nr:hypothetical protein [Ramlibacter sp.]